MSERASVLSGLRQHTALVSLTVLDKKPWKQRLHRKEACDAAQRSPPLSSPEHLFNAP